MTNNKVIDLNFRQIDGARLVVLYESSLMIVFSTIDGSIVKSVQGTSIKCNLGCKTRYDTNLLYLFGIYQQGPSDCLGIYNYDPDTSNAPSTLKCYSHSTYKFYFPEVYRTDNSRFIIAAYSVPSYTMYLAMPTTLT